MKKTLLMRLHCLLFLCFSLQFAFSQTIYNVYGKVGSYIENNIFYDFDGTPLMHLSNENVYMINGKHVGFYVDGIFYNRQGLMVGFKKGAINMITEPEPPKAPKTPLPPIAPLEPAPPRPPLQSRFAINPSLQDVSYGQSNRPNVANINSSESKAVTASDITSYKGNAALAGVSTSETIDNTELNNAVRNLAYSSYLSNKHKSDLLEEAKPYSSLAWEYYYSRDLSKAEYNVRQALAITGNFNFGANYLLGLILRDQGYFQLAIDYLSLAIKEYTNDGDYYTVRGLCYYKLDDKVQAKKDFKIAKRKGDKKADDYLKSLSW